MTNYFIEILKDEKMLILNDRNDFDLRKSLIKDGKFL